MHDTITVPSEVLPTFVWKVTMSGQCHAEWYDASDGAQVASSPVPPGCTAYLPTVPGPGQTTDRPETTASARSTNVSTTLAASAATSQPGFGVAAAILGLLGAVWIRSKSYSAASWIRG